MNPSRARPSIFQPQTYVTKDNQRKTISCTKPKSLSGSNEHESNLKRQFIETGITTDLNFSQAYFANYTSSSLFSAYTKLRQSWTGV